MKIPKEQKYYRAFRTPECECGLLIPKETDVEKVETRGDYAFVKCWQPIINEPPIFFRSTEKVLCFSKTAGGAVIGAVTGETGFTGGKLCICETIEKPDIDISDELVGDFPVLEEVRFHRPVKTKVTSEFTVDAKLLKKITDAYHPEFSEFPDVDRLIKIRKEINRSLFPKQSKPVV